MNEVDRALSDIANIRAQLAASTRFRGIAPEVNALTAVLALVVAAAQSLWPRLLAQDSYHYVTLWASVLIASTVIVAIEAILRSRALHGRMAANMLSSALRLVLPFAAAGTVISFVILRYAPATVWMLPGLWQIFIALVGFSALSNVPRMLGWVAVWYLLCGGIVLGLAGLSGTLSPWMMGIPLTVGQAAVALILSLPGRERDGQG